LGAWGGVNGEPGSTQWLQDVKLGAWRHGCTQGIGEGLMGGWELGRGLMGSPEGPNGPTGVKLGAWRPGGFNGEPGGTQGIGGI